MGDIPGEKVEKVEAKPPADTFMESLNAWCDARGASYPVGISSCSLGETGDSRPIFLLPGVGSALEIGPNRTQKGPRRHT